MKDQSVTDTCSLEDLFVKKNAQFNTKMNAFKLLLQKREEIKSKDDYRVSVTLRTIKQIYFANYLWCFKALDALQNCYDAFSLGYLFFNHRCVP